MPIDRHKTFSDRQSEAARAKKLAVTKAAPATEAVKEDASKKPPANKAEKSANKKSKG